MNSKAFNALGSIVLIAIVIGFPLFLHLDSLPFRLWDESYLAMHAYEMMKNGNYIVTHSFGAPEMSNCKPPFVIWCMVLSSKLLGYSILSIRLPNAIAAVILCFTFFYFLYSYTGKWWLAFLTIVILVSNQGYVRTHVTRSGEYDSFLVLFTLCYSLLFFLIVNEEQQKKRNKLYIMFTISVIVSILTKGVAALISGPGLLLYVILEKKIKTVVLSKAFLCSFMIILIFSMGYYVLRENVNPGYIKAVYENELGGRFLHPLEGHQGPVWLYIQLIFSTQFLYWIPFLVIGLVTLFYSSQFLNNKIRKLLVFAVIVPLSHLIIISLAATKLNFYVAPQYPFYAFIAAIGVYVIVLKITDLSSVLKKIGVRSFVCIICIFPYFNTLQYVMSDKEDPWYRDYYQIGYFLKNAEMQHLNLNNYKLFYKGETIRPILCHIYQLQEMGQQVEIIYLDKLKEGDLVIIHTDSDRELIQSKMMFTEVSSQNNITVWKIGKPRLDIL